MRQDVVELLRNCDCVSPFHHQYSFSPLFTLGIRAVLWNIHRLSSKNSSRIRKTVWHNLLLGHLLTMFFYPWPTTINSWTHLFESCWQNCHQLSKALSSVAWTVICYPKCHLAMKISGHWFTKSESVIILLQECWTVAEKHIFCSQSFSLFSCFSEVTTFSFQMKDKCFSLTSKQLLLVIEQLPKYNSSPYFQTWNLSKKLNVQIFGPTIFTH